MTCNLRRFLPAIVASSCVALMAALSPAQAADKGPIKIGVVSEEAALVGQAISQGARLAADDINAKGGPSRRLGWRW